MKLQLGHGNTEQPLEIPDRNLLGVLEPREAKPVQDIAGQLRQCAATAEQFVEDHGRVLVLVNDYTRATPTNLALAELLPVLSGRDVRFLVCLGTHRPPTGDELEHVFGPDNLARVRDHIVFHDCHDKSRLFFKGRTTRGTDVWFNRELMWAECIIAINSVEPHYFAGFTGGRKSFLPGVAAEETIAHNHNLVIEPGSEPMKLKGNPVHEDMNEAARMVIRPVFSLQFVLDRNHDPFSVYYGDLYSTLEAGATDSRSVYSVPIKERADIVVSVLRPPYDINFYQSQRAVEFARPALKPGGTHICVSACHKGVGNDDFIRMFDGCRTADDVLSRSEENRRLGWHKAARLARIMQSTELCTVVGVPDDYPQRAFMRPFPTVGSALEHAFNRLGADATVFVVPDAAGVVPITAA